SGRTVTIGPLRLLLKSRPFSSTSQKRRFPGMPPTSSATLSGWTSPSALTGAIEIRTTRASTPLTLPPRYEGAQTTASAPTPPTPATAARIGTSTLVPPPPVAPAGAARGGAIAVRYVYVVVVGAKRKGGSRNSLYLRISSSWRSARSAIRTSSRPP